MRLLIAVLVACASSNSLFAQSSSTERLQSKARLSPEAAIAVLRNAEKTGSLVEAAIEVPGPLSAADLENIVLPGQIQSIVITSTTTKWKGAIYSTGKSPITSLAEGLRSYEQLYLDAGPNDPYASFAMTAFTVRGSAPEISRARESLFGASFISIIEASTEMSGRQGSRPKNPGPVQNPSPVQNPASTPATGQEATISAAVGAFTPSNAELNIQTLPNSDRRVEVRFSWNNPADLSGFSDPRSALEVQVLFRNQADDENRNNVSYVGGSGPKAIGATFESTPYFDSPAFNDRGVAGSPYEREVTIGSYNAHSDFQAGLEYMTWAIMERGQLNASFAKLSFQLGIYRPTISGYSWDRTSIAGQNFNGTISGTNFVIGGTRVFFCVNGTSTCYEQPSAGVTVNNSSSLSVINVNLGSGSWQIYVQTSAGQSARSAPFTVF